MSVNEITTLQFGNYSNYISTHYWNSHLKRLLEKENLTEDNQNYLNKLFRESASSRNRYVPRTICFDIKTKLQSLKKDGSFEMQDQQTPELVGEEENVVMYSEPSYKKNDFLKQVQSGEFEADKKNHCDFESEVKCWSDYMMFELDDHSIQLLTETYKDGDDFSFFALGQNEYDSLLDDFEDNLHFWAEECDYMEGFQVF